MDLNGMEDMLGGLDMDKMMSMLGQAKDTIPQAGDLMNLLGQLGEENDEESLDGILQGMQNILDDVRGEYGIIPLIDENGEEHKVQIIDMLELNAVQYYAVCDADAEDGEEAELYFLEIMADDEEGNGNLRFVEEEETYKALFDMYVEKYGEEE